MATIGLVVNLGCARLLQRAAGRSLNMRGAFLHVASDAAGSVDALLAGHFGIDHATLELECHEDHPSESAF